MFGFSSQGKGLHAGLMARIKFEAFRAQCRKDIHASKTLAEAFNEALGLKVRQGVVQVVHLIIDALHLLLHPYYTATTSILWRVLIGFAAGPPTITRSKLH